ncbi:hypothetical protein [Streptomyces sp. NPDC007083]|uniref:hypothetical protein n=1 Tax=unclassified Streptomyces TaxID=2593676 RepID=UPI0033DC6016
MTVRHAGAPDRARAVAGTATKELRRHPWPEGLSHWSLLTTTDGRTLLAYEQWSSDDAVDEALHAVPGSPRVPGIPGTESSLPVRYRLYRSHIAVRPRESAVESRTNRGAGPVGCVVTPEFATDGPEQQRYFVDQVFGMTAEAGQPSGLLSARFHLSEDSTRVVNYAEWTDEQAHIDAVADKDGEDMRQRISAGVPGVRPLGYQRWHLTVSLSAARAAANR